MSRKQEHISTTFAWYPFLHVNSESEAGINPAINVHRHGQSAGQLFTLSVTNLARILILQKYS